MIYKFVKWDVPPLESFKNTMQYKLHDKLEAGQEPTREEKNRNLVFIAQSSPVYKYMGYAYDFREFLKKYWVKTKYYGIIEVYAWDKTAIRQNESTKSLQIIQIVEAE